LVYPDPASAWFGARELEISSSNLTFNISLVQIDTLKPHEEVIEPLVQSLADAMRIQGIVRDPLIVDQDKLVILDGMHRHVALKVLGCRFAPCCLVDYDNPLIKVGSWFRLFNVKDTESVAEKILSENMLSYTKQKMDTAGPDVAPCSVILTNSGTQYCLPRDTDPIELSRAAVALEKAMVRQGYHVDYLSETVALQNLKLGSVNFVIALPVFSKEQIRNFGVRGSLLPHKTTRHVMPSRPLRIDIPLKLLREKYGSQERADLELRNALSARRVETKLPGSVVDGRRYEEELLVFTG
jgi:hypothetical protein